MVYGQRAAHLANGSLAAEKRLSGPFPSRVLSEKLFNPKIYGLECFPRTPSGLILITETGLRQDSGALGSGVLLENMSDNVMSDGETSVVRTAHT